MRKCKHVVAKRVIDSIMSLIAIIILLPLTIPIALILRLTGEGEILYRQVRVGQNGKRIRVAKFATMLKDSPNIGTRDITAENDSRVLPVGKFLRKTKLNEIPQFLNVLFGTMSLVGPRPLTERIFSYYSDADQELIKRMRPGLTGVGSIIFRDEESAIRNSSKPIELFYKEDIVPYKALLERWYYEHRSAVNDLLILVVTVVVVMRPRSIIYRKIWKDLPEADERRER